MKNKHTLSIIIIAKNEERVIRETLESVKDIANEIIMLDSGSEDSTVSICREYTDKVFETDWPGYGVQKNRALDKATCDWVLSIDADEIVSDELKNSIVKILNDDSDSIDCYIIKVKLYYFGKYIRSLLKRKAPILFRRDKGRFAEIAVHEYLQVPSGKYKYINGYLLHKSCESLQHQIMKLNKYADIWSDEKIREGIYSKSIIPAFTHSLSMLVKDCVIHQSFLDGWRGLLLTVIHANYTFNKYAFLRAKSFESGNG